MSRGSRLARWRVPLGFLLGLVLLWAAAPTRVSLAVGLPVAALGVGLRAVAAGHIRKNEALATSGPYRFTRNPLYLGSTVLAFGLVIAAASWLLAGLAVLMLLGVYLPVIREEERHLAARFGAAFHAYAARVPRLIPWRLPARVDAERREGTRFSFRLYCRHREYQALLGYVAISAVLIAKWSLPVSSLRLGWW